MDRIQTLDYDYFLVCSFEFTCDGKKTLEPQEIIEFCVVKFCVRSQTVKDKFYSLVKPQHPINVKLSTFCKMLTGISDRKLFSAPSLPEVLISFDTWMGKQGLFQMRFIFIPFTHFDLQHMLLAQCKALGYHCPAYFFTWIHMEEFIKQYEKTQVTEKPKVKQIRRMSSQNMLSKYGVVQEGRQHSAVDNCTNTVNLIINLMNRGIDFKGKVWETFIRRKRRDKNAPEEEPEAEEHPELDPKEEGMMALLGLMNSNIESGRNTPTSPFESVKASPKLIQRRISCPARSFTGRSTPKFTPTLD